MRRYATVLFLFVLLTGILYASGVDAQSGATAQNCPPGTLCNPLKAESLSAFLQDLFRAIVKIGLPIVVLFIVWAGFLFVKARGNATELTTAKRNFGYVILGTTIFLGAWVIAEMVAATLRQLGV